MRTRLAVFVMLGLAFWSSLHAFAAEPVFAPPPRLATTAKELDELRKSPGFPAIRAAAIQKGEARLATPVVLPAGAGSWIFYYACPVEGADLRPVSLAVHECPQCKKRYDDERTVAAYRCKLHYELEHAALDLGWAYVHSGEHKYAREVQRILLFLADEYAKYPQRLDRWGRSGWLAPLGGRRYVQSLDEAVGVIKLAKAYDLCRTCDIWTEAQQKHVEEDFFAATAKTLLAFNQGINNHQTWYNAGLMAIASVRGDAKLVRQVLEMKGGFHDQLARSISAEGLWYEGAMSYQNYALQAMVEIVETGRRLGLDLSDDASFKRLLASPLDVAYPNGDYPAINDSDPASFRMFDWSYDWAWLTYRDPRFAQALAWGDPKKLQTLLGPDTPVASPFPAASQKLEEAGLVILRAGSGPTAACVFHDFGPHGGGHGHYDKLGITLFAAGREWLLDPGRIGYSHREYKTWVKHTVAHNTVVINHASQWPTAGKLLGFKSGEGWSGCVTECSTAYLGVTLRRHLVLHESFLLDVFEVDANRSVTMDWLAHAVTAPVVPVAPLENISAEPLGKGDGYEHLTQVKAWTVTGPSQWDFAATAAGQRKAETSPRLRVTIPRADAESVFTAQGIGYQPTQAAPCLIRRRQAKQARFVTVYDLSGKGTAVASVEESKDHRDRLTVQLQNGKHWFVKLSPDGPTAEPARP